MFMLRVVLPRMTILLEPIVRAGFRDRFMKQKIAVKAVPNEMSYILSILLRGGGTEIDKAPTLRPHFVQQALERLREIWAGKGAC